MELLNEYSGLFSLLAVVASVVAIVVSVVIFNKQKKEQEKYYNKQKKDQEYFYLRQQQDHLQDLQDEYEAIESNSMFPMSLAEREYFGRKKYLEKKLRRE